MSSVIKVNACVYSRIGYGREQNTNSFYMNGKFMSEQHIENVQASMENRGTEYLFTVADNLSCSDDENDTQVSILKEVSKYHEKITVNGGDLRFKIKELESRITDSNRLMAGWLEMNRIPPDDPRWDIGFGGILVSEGQFVAAASGTCKIFMMRDGMFRPLAAEASKAKRMIDAKTVADTGEEDNIVLPDEDPNSTIVLSDIYDIAEGDTFLICSSGVLNAIGEEKTEDLLSLRSDSTYIAFRLVDEAMKRNSAGDLTAMVIQVEKLYEGTASAKKASVKSDNVKNRVDRLNKTAPTVAYKYNRKKSSKYQGTVTMVLLILTVAALFGIIYIIINSMINTGKTNLPTDLPTVSASATPTATPEESVEPSETPAVEETPLPTPTPEVSGEIQTHKIAKGETMNKVAKDYYGSSDYADELCKYNNISNPNLIQIGQEIKIPPVEDLK